MKSILWLTFVVAIFGNNFTHCFPFSLHSFSGILETPEEKRDLIRSIAKESWTAFLHNSNATGLFDHNAGSVKDATDIAWRVVAGMVSLKVMGLDEEFVQTKKWLEKDKFDFVNISFRLNTNEMVGTCMASLLSCYALTGEEVFLNKTLQIAKLIESVYDTPTGIPKLREHKKIANDPMWKFITWQKLSWFTGQQIEFTYLTNLTGDPVYANRNGKMRNFLKHTDKPNGLYMNAYDFETNKWATNLTSLFGEQTILLFGLVQSYVQTNGRDVEALQMYSEAMDAVEKNELITTSNEGFTYVRTFNQSDESYGDYMEVSGCSLGALLSLGAEALRRGLAANASIDIKPKQKQLTRIDQHWKWAKDLTETCRHASNNTTNHGLTPWVFYFTETEEAGLRNDSTSAFQFQDLPHSYLILWRLTNDAKYREYAWEMAQNVYNYIKLPNSTDPKMPKVKVQPISFMETLQYLYLTFSNDTVLPLDQWIKLNAPLPVLL